MKIIIYPIYSLRRELPKIAKKTRRKTNLALSQRDFLFVIDTSKRLGTCASPSQSVVDMEV